MRFEFATAAPIVFGRGRLAEAGDLARGLGRRALVVTGGSRRHAESLTGLLIAAGLSSEVIAFAGEPAADGVLAGLDQAKWMAAFRRSAPRHHALIR